ncbi:DMT family transporter [Dermacoccaceae bacterium W4C1]
MPTEPPTEPHGESAAEVVEELRAEAEKAGAATLPLLGALACGALIAMQSRLNGVVSEHSGQWVLAALWSFGSGLVILCLIAAASPRVRGGIGAIRTSVTSGALRWYHCIGGVIGGIFVAVQSWSVPAIGVAIFSVAALGGQTLFGLAADRVGMGVAGKQPITGTRVLFALLAIAAVVVSASGRSGSGGVSWAVVIACFVIGGCVTFQQALNGRVNHAVHQPLATAWQNFLLGTLTLAVVAIGVAFVSDAPWTMPHEVPWWAWFGGACGIGFVAITSWAINHLGVLVFGLVSVAGQLSTALALDLLDPQKRGTVGAALIIGVLISLVSAGGAAIAASRAH